MRNGFHVAANEHRMIRLFYGIIMIIILWVPHLRGIMIELDKEKIAPKLIFQVYLLIAKQFLILFILFIQKYIKMM